MTPAEALANIAMDRYEKADEEADNITVIVCEIDLSSKIVGNDELGNFLVENNEK